MSTICGIYYKDKAVNISECEAVMGELGKYRFDKTGTFNEGPVFLGCHINCVTTESLNEVLPYKDKVSSLVITADAIIYNRQELFELLPISEENEVLPDSILILEAYKKWGTTCTERLIGDYAFSIWDTEKKELFCVRDHVGKRSFYYYNDSNVFAFSTLIKPLFKIEGLKKELNETYIADFLSNPSINHEIDANITLYVDIYQLPPAHAMLVNKDGIKCWRYWEIKKTKEIHFETDKEYEEAFRKIYSEAVKCRLRSVKKVGIMLSGGLDSGSVACFAAPELKKRNERLYGFTQIPMEDYKNFLPDRFLADEREYVEEIGKFTGNIEFYPIASKYKSSITEIDEMIETLEQPYKIFENSYWINEIFRTASDMGIGVLLSGQTGNATVSWGSFNAYVIYLLKAGRFKTFFKEIKVYSERKNINKMRLFLNTLFNFMPYSVKVLKYKIRGGIDAQNILSPINKDFYKSMKVKKRFKKYNLDPLYISHGDSFFERKKILGTVVFSHIGALETKTALAFGVEKRDPTRDKRVIEFCINLPESQWVRDGEERRFIRHAMEGYMPDKVRLNTTVRGRQAADWVQRIMPEWEKAYEEIATIGEYELERKYLDIPRIKQLLSQNRELKYDDDGNRGIRFLIRALIFTRFLRNLEQDEEWVGHKKTRVKPGNDQRQ